MQRRIKMEGKSKDLEKRVMIAYQLSENIVDWYHKTTQK